MSGLTTFYDIYNQLYIVTAKRTYDGAREHSNLFPTTFRERANPFACIS